MEFSAWGNTEKTELSLLESRVAKMHKEKGLLEEEAKLLYTIFADTWEEAMAVHHIRQGLEPYKPEGEASQCPNICGALYYPKGSATCRNCGVVA